MHNCFGFEIGAITNTWVSILCFLKTLLFSSLTLVLLVACGQTGQNWVGTLGPAVTWPVNASQCALACRSELGGNPGPGSHLAGQRVTVRPSLQVRSGWEPWARQSPGRSTRHSAPLPAGQNWVGTLGPAVTWLVNASQCALACRSELGGNPGPGSHLPVNASQCTLACRSDLGGNPGPGSHLPGQRVTVRPCLQVRTGWEP